MAVIVRTEEPPNPNAHRYVLSRPVQEQSKGRYFRSAAEAEDPLAKTLFEVPGVEGVMLLPNSVTVNKANEAKWDAVDPAAKDAIEAYFA